VSDKHKDKDKDRDQPRTGSVTTADADLTTWLHSFWARDEFPEAIEVWQTFGRNKQDRGKQIHHVTFRANDRLDQERCTKLTNEMIAAMQNDADVIGRPQHYEIAIVDKHRRALPTVRRFGPVRPKQAYLAQQDGGGSSEEEGDDGDFPVTGKNLALAYTDRFFNQIQWDKQRYDAVIGDMLGLQRSTILEQRGFIEKLMGQVMTMFVQTQEALDRSADRELARKKSEMWLAMMGDGVRMARNLVPALLGQAPDAAGAQPVQLGAQPAAAPRLAPPSREQTLVDNFLHDCEATKISITLFGDWEQDASGRLLQKAPGIFSKEQFSILLGVRERALPPEALDVLLPDSGHALAVTMDQMAKVEPIMTAGTATSLIEAFNLRRAARERAQARAQSTPQDAPESKE
jgi:hypothetical protein